MNLRAGRCALFRLLLGLGLGLLWASFALAQQPSLVAGPADEWQLEWAEEFDQPGDSSALSARWRFCYPWGRSLGDLETEYYTGDAVRRDAGNLYLIANQLAQPRPYRGKALKYSSGMLFSRHPGPDSLQPATCHGDDGFSYGLFEIRCRQPRDPNAFPAFWLYGNPDEVDIFEADYGGFSSTVHVMPNSYWRPDQVASIHCSCYFYDPARTQNLHQRYHTYGLAWRPDELTFYFDGYPIRHETRYTPLGCPLSLIVNLAMWSWATPTADTLAIDYIRVYRPKRPYADPVLRRPGGTGPHPTSAWLPAATNPSQPDPSPRQEWSVRADSTGHLQLHLVHNYNPACGTWQALPNAQTTAWSPPWTLESGLPTLRLHFVSLLPVEWALLDPLGRPVRTGVVPEGAEWQPLWTTLPPGSYQLWLRQGAHEGIHPVVVVGRPVASVPDAAWLRPGAVAEPAQN